MIGAAFALVLLGIALLFFSPWAGIVVGAAGFAFAILVMLGLGRRAATGGP